MIIHVCILIYYPTPIRVITPCARNRKSSGVSSRLENLSNCTANLRTKTLEFRGFDSSIISNLRGGILMFLGSFAEIMSQRILKGIILVGRLGVSVTRSRISRQP